MSEPVTVPPVSGEALPLELTREPGKECLGRWAHRRIAVWDPPLGQPGARFTNRWRCSTCGEVGIEPKRWEQ